MKSKFLLSLFAFSLSVLVVTLSSSKCFAQTETTTTQTTTPPLKDRIVGKWMYNGIEEFGVLTPPDSTQKNDFVEIGADGNFKMMWGGKEEAGAYKLVIDYKQIYMSDVATKKTKMFTIKSSLNGKLVLDYQTPELIHHKYQYEKVTQ